MEEETKVDAETLESDVVETTEEVISKEDLEKAQEIAKNQEIRAKKAEDELKKLKSQHSEKVEQTSEFSLVDQMAILKANIEVDDVEKVVEYAKFKKIDIKTALESPVLKAILDEEKEKRTSALVTAVNTQRRAPSKPSDELVLDKFNKGEIPAPGSKEAEQLFWALKGKKKPQ